MKKLIFIMLLWISFSSCKHETPTQFSEAALQEQLITVNGKTVTLESILKKHKGKTILITLWATWCRDCTEEIPRIKALQHEKNEVVYVFLSLDRAPEKWIKGISKLEIAGDHYFLPMGWEGPFVDFIDLDWITRYMVIDPQSNIKLFKAIKVNNKKLRKSITN